MTATSISLCQRAGSPTRTRTSSSRDWPELCVPPESPLQLRSFRKRGCLSSSSSPTTVSGCLSVKLWWTLIAGKLNVDISLNQTNGISAGRIINQYLDILPGARQLVLVVKAFLSQRSMNEVYTGGLGSYAVICMVISFLQVSCSTPTLLTS